LQEVNPQLEEAGDGPRRQALAGVLPGHAADDLAGAASAWLLTFSLSLDDVVVSAFLSGPARPPCRW
jgi:putrescine transport system permease protein